MKNPKQKLRLEADRLFKEIVLVKADNKCEVCGSDFGVTAHHYFYRSNSAHLRYNLDNGVALCRKCHFSLHFKDSKLMEIKIIAKRGQKWVKKLTSKALDRPIGTFLTLKWYDNQFKRLQKYV